MRSTISIYTFIWYSILCYLVGLLSGYFPAKIWYTRIINSMIAKNKHLKERVEKAEGVILRDLLQLSPDDVIALNKTLEERVKSSTEE